MGEALTSMGKIVSALLFISLVIIGNRLSMTTLFTVAVLTGYLGGYCSAWDDCKGDNKKHEGY